MYPDKPFKKYYIKDKYIVGIAPSKNKHQAAIIGPDGSKINYAFTFPVNYEGYNQILWENFHKIPEMTNCEEIVFAIENSYHLWVTITYYLIDKNYKVVLVDPLSNKNSKSFSERASCCPSPQQARRIANRAHKGHFNFHYEWEPNLKSIRRLSITYNKLCSEYVRVQQQVRSLVEIIFPEFFHVLSLDTQAALYLLERYLTPENFIEMDSRQEAKTIERLSRGIYGYKTLLQIKEFAVNSIGIKRMAEALSVDRHILDAWLTLLRSLKQQLDQILNHLASHSHNHPDDQHTLYNNETLSKSFVK